MRIEARRDSFARRSEVIGERSSLRRQALALAVLLFVPLVGLAEAGRVALPLLTHRVDPKAFGVDAETITVISAWSFTGAAFSGSGNADAPYFSGSLGRFNANFDRDTHYFATVDVPAGAVIDFIGINSSTDTDAIIGIALWQRDSAGGTNMLTGFSLPAHGWSTDFAGPLNIHVDTHQDREYVLDVEQAPASGFEFWAWVEVHWHRTVSPPPGSPTFADVPPSDLGFQYIEALAASGITGGCGGGNYCPAANVTRRQMAIFLAKALGLHWPN